MKNIITLLFIGLLLSVGAQTNDNLTLGTHITLMHYMMGFKHGFEIRNEGHTNLLEELRKAKAQWIKDEEKSSKEFEQFNKTNQLVKPKDQ